MAVQKGITHEDIVRDVRAGKIAPIYYLMGEEPYYIDKVSDFIVDAVLKPDEKDFNLDIVYGADVTLNQVIELARAYPMMAERRVVLVREAQAIRSLDGLEQYALHLTPSTVLILCHKNGTLDKRKAAAKAIQQVGVIYESRRLYESQLPAFITGYVRRGRAEIESQAVQMLADHVGADLSRLSAEMDKLLLALTHNTHDGGGTDGREQGLQQLRTAYRTGSAQHPQGRPNREVLSGQSAQFCTARNTFRNLYIFFRCNAGILRTSEKRERNSRVAGQARMGCPTRRNSRPQDLLRRESHADFV